MLIPNLTPDEAKFPPQERYGHYIFTFFQQSPVPYEKLSRHIRAFQGIAN